MHELSSSGTFNRDLMEYSFGNGTTTCLLNLSGDTPNAGHLGQRNQGIRISFDFAAANDMNLVENSPISNCSTRQPSIASGFEIPILQGSGTKLSNRQLSPQNIPKINKELLTVQRPAGRSISSEDLIYVNAMEVPSSGCSGESTLSAPEQHGVRPHTSSASSSNKHLNKSSNNQSSIRNKFKLSKYKKKKMKAEQMEKQTMKRSEHDENLNENNSKERVFLSVKEFGTKKSSSYLSLLRRSTKRKNRGGQSYES